MRKFLISAFVQLLVFGVLGSLLLTGAIMALLTFGFWHENPSINLFGEMGHILLLVVPSAAVYTCGIGLLDFVLQRLAVPYRMVISAVVAMGSMAWLVWMFGNLEQPAKLAGFCLMAALSAALCSWLSHSFANRTSPPAASITALPANTASPG